MYCSCRTLLLFHAFCITFTFGNVVLPKPAGEFGVNVNVMKMTDTSRIDPYAPSHQFRSVMISGFYPAVSAKTCQTYLADYMPPATAAAEDALYAPDGAPNGTFESVKLSLCKDDPQMAKEAHRFPLVLFSPGLGNSRLTYNALAQSVASYGYVVVTIDHPYDANVVEYPDGTLIFAANISTVPEFTSAMKTRVQDVNFVLRQLSLQPTVDFLLPLYSDNFNFTKAAMFGHSLGGATAASAMANNTRFVGGVNLDGMFLGPVITEGVKNPFLIFGNQAHNQSSDASWAAFWPNIHAWKLELLLRGARHGTFSDLPLLVKISGLAKLLLPGVVADLLGTIDGERAHQIVVTYLVAFADFVLKEKHPSLLRGPENAYPEVVFVNKTSQ